MHQEGPFGGVALMWHRQIERVVFPTSTVSDRVVAVQLLTSVGTVLVIAVYMPVMLEQWMTTLLNLVTSVGC